MFPLKIEEGQFFIRPAQESDLTEILELFKASVQGLCQSDYRPEQIKIWLKGSLRTDRWLSAIQNQYFVVAFVGDQMAGFGSLDHDYLDFLFVHPLFVRKGIALSIYQQLEKQAIMTEQKQLKSEVSITAQPFFHKMGFVIKENQVKVIDGVEIQNFVMSKQL